MHSLSVEALLDGRSLFRTHEDATAILLPPLGKVMRPTQCGFERLAETVKARAEGGYLQS